MSWEQRNGKKVFYLAERRGKRIVKKYCGAGMIAQLAAANVERCRELERVQRQHRKMELQRVAEAMDLAAAFAAFVQGEMIERLDQLGFHCPKGRGWRRKREAKTG